MIRKMLKDVHPGQEFLDPTPESGVRWVTVRHSAPCPGSKQKHHINGTDCWDARYPVYVK